MISSQRIRCCLSAISVKRTRNSENMSSCIKKQISVKLHDFVRSSLPFQVVHSSSSKEITPLTKKLLILDSSFNPPHKGHYSLIKKSFHYRYSGKSLTTDNATVVLLLSVNNVDKTPQPASFEDRLQMMCLLADYIEVELGVAVVVALTHHAKFVDKSVAIQEWISTRTSYDEAKLKLTFLVGFDTVIRIFNSKYYSGMSLREALSEFMKRNELFCLTRTDDKNFSITEQRAYIDDIKNGRNPDIPKEWSEAIYIDNGDTNSLHISSSMIRRLVSHENDTEWEPLVIDSIKHYIHKEKLYSNL